MHRSTALQPGDDDNLGHPGAVARSVLRHRDGGVEAARDLVASEVPVAFVYNATPFAVMMATPHDLEDFAVGFSLGEGFVDNAADLCIEAIDSDLEGITVRLGIPERQSALLAQRQRSLPGRSGCGVCGAATIEAVLRPPPPVHGEGAIHVDALQRALQELRGMQSLNALTGATHAAGWAAGDGQVALVREDVGRHNALDKLVGALARADIDAASGFAVITSRASYEMVMKAAQAGIPLLAAISAPTALAIALAESSRLTLVGFARDDGHVVYSNPQRLSHAATTAPTQ